PRRLRHPQILADLDMKGEGCRAAGGKQQVAAERRLIPGDRDRLANRTLARGEMPPLVELTVIRQEHLGDDAEQRAMVNDDAAIVETPLQPERRTDDKNREELAARTNQSIELAHDPVEHCVLKQKIVDRIG